MALLNVISFVLSQGLIIYIFLFMWYLHKVNPGNDSCIFYIEKKMLFRLLQTLTMAKKVQVICLHNLLLCWDWKKYSSLNVDDRIFWSKHWNCHLHRNLNCHAETMYNLCDFDRGYSNVCTRCVRLASKCLQFLRIFVVVEFYLLSCVHLDVFCCSILV